MNRLALIFALVTSGCASSPYVRIADVPKEQTGQDYVIASGDVISVRVFNQDPMSTRARVRSDGKIAVPFLGDVAVRGQTPASVSKALEAQFKAYVVSPIVTVTVEEM